MRNARRVDAQEPDYFAAFRAKAFGRFSDLSERRFNAGEEPLACFGQ